jgi:hypothetical protein
MGVMVRVAWLVTLAAASTAAFFLVQGLIVPSAQGLSAAECALLVTATVIPYVITRALQELARPHRETTPATRPQRVRQNMRTRRPPAEETQAPEPRTARATARAQSGTARAAPEKVAAGPAPATAAVVDAAASTSLSGLVSRVFPRTPAH